ncbi:hypothetical protein [Endozoicomonas arenosclerae]|uniref:hypothetical protein n=1 Tax=Endozoicomonas arenosclerae TaxID=1633495 RepID=UPI00078559AC|nr:hypothetical protein [Endozoicomonas arenosclerae]
MAKYHTNKGLRPLISVLLRTRFKKGSKLEVIRRFLSEGGIITEILNITVVSIGNGVYEVSLLSAPRLDLLFIAQLPGQTVNLETSSLLPGNAMFAPGIDTNIRLDAASTISSRLLLEELDSLNDLTLDEVNSLIDSMDREQMDNLANLSDSLENYLLQSEREFRNFFLEKLFEAYKEPATLDEMSSTAGQYSLSSFSLFTGAGFDRSLFTFENANSQSSDIQFESNELSMLLGETDSFGNSIYMRDRGLYGGRSLSERAATKLDDFRLNSDGTLTLFIPEIREEKRGFNDPDGPVNSIEIYVPSVFTLYPVVAEAYIGILGRPELQYPLVNGNLDFNSFFDTEIEKSLVFLNKDPSAFNGNISDSYGFVELGLSADFENTDEQKPHLIVASATGSLKITGSSAASNTSTNYNYEATTTASLASSSFVNVSLSLPDLIGRTVNENGSFLVNDKGSVHFSEDDTSDRMQFSSNGQLLWRTSTKPVNEGEEDSIKVTSISIGIRSDKNASLDSLNEKTFLVKGLSFNADTNSAEGDLTRSDLEIADFSATEVSFSGNSLILKGRQNYNTINTDDDVMEFGVEPFTYSIPITIENGKITGSFKIDKNGEPSTLRVNGYVGTDEDSTAGSDALVFTLSSASDDVETINNQRVVKYEINHSILVAIPK